MAQYPQAPQPDLAQSMAALSVDQQPREQSQLGRKAKRPARVFHTEFPGAAPYSDPSQTQGHPNASPAPFYNNTDWISPIESSQQPTQPTRSFFPYQQQAPTTTSYSHDISHGISHGHPNGQIQLGPESQPQSFVPVPQHNGNPEITDPILPSVSEDRASAQKNLGPAPVFKTFENACPPPAGTDYDVQDQGLSGPQFARLTMYNVPTTNELRVSTKLPLGMLLRPFAPVSNKDYECGGVSTVDFSDAVSPPRCQRCRTYMNPSMLFTEGGTKFVCNMCQFSNEVSSTYFQPIDSTNRRIDWQTRPELAFGTYDINVPRDYWKEEGVEPVPLHHLVLIDVSRDAIKKELPKLAVEAIRAALYGNGLDPGENAVHNFTAEVARLFDASGNPVNADPHTGIKYPPKAKIGIATYDRTVQFYSLNPTLEQAQMIVMNDIDDPFVPIEEGMFVDPEESRYVIEDLLDRIDLLFEDNPIEEPVFGCALNVALKALKSTGGKVSAILSSLPSRGPGSLAIREGTPNFMGDKEQEIFNPDSTYYEDLGKEYALAGVGLDLFVFPSTLCDLANTGNVCQISGGHEHFYPRFVPQRDGRRFIADFCKSAEGTIASQAQLKVRSSTGLQVAAYYGNFYHNGWEEEPIFGTLDNNSTIGVLFRHDGKLDPKLDAHFQSALLYTTSDGQRRVRVTNLIASVTEQFRPVLNFIDLDTTIGIMARDSVSRMGESPLSEIRNRITERLVEVFAAYTKHINASHPSNQLLMPMSLRGLIMYLLALEKSRPLREQQVSHDSRIHAGRLINGFSSNELSLFLYPRVIGLHNLQPVDCTYSENGLFNLPVNVKASMAALDIGGVYMAYNGQGILLWIHNQVSPVLLKDLFGEHAVSLESLDPFMNELPEIDTEISHKARALVKYFANKSCTRFLGIQLARWGLDGADYEFQALMVEDRATNTLGYVDFVSHVHKLVRNKLDSSQEKRTFNSNFISENFGFAHMGL